MKAEELKNRTKKFALNMIRLTETFPKTNAANTIGHQLLRSATSVGANYRSACRAQSHVHFISKISVALEEADESLYWLELAVDSGVLKRDNVDHLFKEANELIAILASSLKTARKNQ